MTGGLSPGAFLFGAVLLAVTFGCAAASAAIAVRRRFSDLRGAPRGVAWGILTVAGLLTVHLVPLALGVLARGTVVVTAVALLLATHRFVSSPKDEPSFMAVGAPQADNTRTAPGITRSLVAVSWGLGAAGVLLTLGWWLGYLESHAGVRVTSVDTLSFHLPGVVRFIQTGTLWQTTQYLPGQAQGNYPQYGDLLLLVAVLPWHSAGFIRYVDPVLLCLAGLAVFGIARELRAPTPAAALAACALLAVRPAVGSGLVNVLTDPAFLAGFASGTLFLLRHWRTRRRRELILAGIGLGIALGTKWYGLTDVPALVLIWAIAGLARRSGRSVAADGGMLVGVIALAGGVWLVRNLILTGNPVFDYRFSLFGVTIFPAPASAARAQIGFSLAHYAGNLGVLRRYVWPAFRSDFGLPGGLIVVGAAAAAALVGHDSARRRRRGAVIDVRIATLAVTAVALAVAYAITPYSAQGYQGAPILVDANTRYGVPALLVAAPLLGWLATRIGPARVLLEAALLAAVAVSLRRNLPLSSPRVAAGVLVVAAMAAVWRYGLPPMRRRPRRRLAGGALATAVACVVVVLLYHYQRVLGAASYSPADPTVSYVLAHDPADTRIAITGEWTAQGLVPVAPLFGPRFQNRLDYLGPSIEHRREEYTRAAPFESALRSGRYEFLIVGTGFPPKPDPIQERWAEAAGYVPIEKSSRLVLLRPSPT